MGRGRGKGRKSNDDHGSGEEEKIPIQKRRGRPQKPLKEDTDEEVADKINEEEEANSGLTNKERNRPSMESGKKRKKKEKRELSEEENGTEVKSPSIVDSVKSHRRKGKPCRAAEACVECS